MTSNILGYRGWVDIYTYVYILGDLYNEKGRIVLTMTYEVTLLWSDSEN